MECIAITKSTGLQCQRDAEPSSEYCWQHKSATQTPSIVKVLPKDIFTNIGGYLGYKDLGVASQSGLPRQIYLKKYCITLEFESLDTVQHIIKNYPRLKNLRILDDYMVLNDELVVQLIELLKNIKGLEALILRSDFFDERININWQGFSKLRYLDLDNLIVSDTQIYDLVIAVPTLEHLKINTEFYMESKNENPIPKTLKFLDYHSNPDPDNLMDVKTPNLQSFQNLKALRTNLFYVLDLLRISEINLDVLSITRSDDYDFLYRDTINYFPTQLRFLYIQFIGYNDAIFSELDFPFLEFLGMSNLSSLGHIIDFLPKYPKLQHLYLNEIKFFRLSPEFMEKLKDLRKKIPELTLDFDTIKSTKLIELLSDAIGEGNEDYYIDVTILLDREVIAEKKYWKEFRSIFNLSNLVEIDGKKELESHSYTQDQWLTDHDYYVNLNCTE